MPEETAEGTESCSLITKSELQELLGSGYMVESFTSQRLTQPGDNYFSNIQAVEVTLLPDHSTLSLVAKLPPTSVFLQQLSKFGSLLSKEKRMYLEVAKVFQDLYQESSSLAEQMVDFFPRCYGAHVSYKDDRPVAEKSALLLENLLPLGYRCADRIIGLDLAHTDLALSRLACFHATAIAVKLKKPDVFKNIILPACENVKPEGPPPEDDKMEKMKDRLLGRLERIEGILTYLGRLKECISALPDFGTVPREPFASIRHGDFWTNNILFKYNAERLPTDVRFVDFQVAHYDSPARDLIFFLYSSTELGLVPEQYDHFIHLYHKQFTDQLMKLGCDTKPFSCDVLKEEIDRVAPKELQHCLFMINIITREKHDAPDMSQINSHEDMAKLFDSSNSEEYNRRVVQLITEFSKKGWL